MKFKHIPEGRFTPQHKPATIPKRILATHCTRMAIPTISIAEIIPKGRHTLPKRHSPLPWKIRKTQKYERYGDFHSPDTFGISRLQRPPGSGQGSRLSCPWLRPARGSSRKLEPARPVPRPITTPIAEIKKVVKDTIPDIIPAKDIRKLYHPTPEPTTPTGSPDTAIYPPAYSDTCMKGNYRICNLARKVKDWQAKGKNERKSQVEVAVQTEEEVTV
ncbi:hypothetical protein EV426DRAFT_575287 [Tirmania nivea]|nr:hypothetical protein EV426DRAFT_575287 [Tirmania nivea]